MLRSAFRTSCSAFALVILLAGGAVAQMGDRMERNRSLDLGGAAERRRIEVYEPPALTGRRMMRPRRTASRTPRMSTRMSRVPPWWEVYDDVTARRRDRRAAWYFGLSAPYGYRRF